MPAALGSGAKLYASGVDLSGFMTKADVKYAADMVDTTTWGASARTYMPGLTDGGLMGEGIWDFNETSLDRPDNVLPALLGAAGNISYMPQGDTAGAIAHAIQHAGETSLEYSSPIDDVVTFSFEVQATGASPLRGVVLQPQQGALNITVTGNSTGLDDQPWKASGWATVNGGIGILHCLNKGGAAGTLTVKVQHATVLGGPYVDLLTFSGVTAKGQSDWKAVSAGTTINQFLRASWTVATGTWDISVIFARKQ